MTEKPPSGTLFGIPYNFEKPKLRRLIKSYWQPGRGMLVEKPFGIGYTLNLANWKSWVLLAVAGVLYYLEKQGEREEVEERAEAEPVEVIVDE